MKRPSPMRFVWVGTPVLLALSLFWTSFYSLDQELSTLPEVPTVTTRALACEIDAALDVDPPPEVGTPSAEPPRAAPAADPIPDDEWYSLPRDDDGVINLPTWVKFDGKLDVRRLFRNERLNPHDVFIPKHRRNQLAPRLAPLVGKLHRLYQTETKYQHEQLNLMVANGNLKPRSKTPTPELLDLVRKDARRGLDQCAADPRYGPEAEAIVAELRDQLANPEKYAHQFGAYQPHTLSMHDEKGDWYELDVRRLPRQASLDSARRFLEVEFVGSLLQWFQIQGTITAKDQHRYLEDLATRHERGN